MRYGGKGRRTGRTKGLRGGEEKAIKTDETKITREMKGMERMLKTER